MSAKTIVSARFEPRDDEDKPLTEQQQFLEEIRREYWHEATEAGCTREEAEKYAVLMTK